MQAFYSDHHVLPLPATHRFPIDKYRCLRDCVARNADAWGIELRKSPEACRTQLARVHTSTYLDKVFGGRLTDREQRRIGFPWSPAMLKRCLHSTGGTIAAAHQSLQDGFSAHLAGGTHHAFADAGQGYCVFNDVAVAATELIQLGKVRKVVVIDCDVHQGNGTASIFADQEDVFTFSMHGDRNFPFRKFAGDLDLALPDGLQDKDYLALLNEALETRLPLHQADCVFYLAGADVFAGDRLGRLQLSKSGIRARDETVLRACHQRGLPITIVMSGGYAPDIQDVVEIHAETLQLAASFVTKAMR